MYLEVPERTQAREASIIIMYLKQPIHTQIRLMCKKMLFNIYNLPQNLQFLSPLYVNVS
jgi:hypothetical protein